MRLAVCDEQWLFASVLATALTQHGHSTVLTTDDPAVLLNQAAAARIEVCVLDIGSAFPAALEVVLQLAALDPRPAVVLLTDSCHDGVWEAYGQGLFQGVVNKACAFSVLLAAIDRVAGGERVSEGWRPSERRPDLGVVDSLTSRELEVLRLVVRGRSTQLMANELGVSRHTIRTHVQQILRKLDVHSRGKIARAAATAGLLDAATLSSAESPPG
jgi:DNA-binding NarL/FixJ family response regulator